MSDFHTARLISITNPTPEILEELGINSAEGLTAYITRVSNPSNQNNDDIAKLLNYCAKHGHWSVFQHCFLTVEVITTKDISSQIIRHRSLSFMEFSLRYASVDSLDEPFEYPEMRIQDTKNRQNSIDAYKALQDGIIDAETFTAIDQKTIEAHKLMDKVYDTYLELLELGVAKETARRILPVAHSSKIYISGSIRDFIFYIKARNSKDGKSQKEHSAVADSIENIFKREFPIVYKAMFNN